MDNTYVFSMQEHLEEIKSNFFICVSPNDLYQSVSIKKISTTEGTEHCAAQRNRMLRRTNY